MIIIRMVLAIVIVLGGCSTQPKIIQSFDSAVLEAHVSRVVSIDSWTIRGRLGIRTDRGGQIGRMVWTRSGVAHQIDVYGSLGSGHLRITVQPDEAVLVDSDGQELRGSTAQAVLEEYIGWPFPVAQLGSWIIGVADPESPALQTWDSDGYVRSIDQAGWQVSLSRYGQFDGHHLPTRYRLVATEQLQNEMLAKRPDQALPSQIRLVINSWALN